ncbi:glycosyltransferase family protein [Bosea sp. (in: a-proteobacteria)]|jgi:predicted glycosyltransferase|uniref:glycosyltransferase family protein n=1 Tax=Bosea sp. (in: a-proteobacteria) TaxID=1871050 RepID=UPI002DDCF734|nr:glycosyltransferase [Bosea sp. (in: a-proteobacteria)]
MWLESLSSDDHAPLLTPPGRPGLSRTRLPLRVLMYSHDTFGLGHLRRSRVIAEALTRQNSAIEVTILTGAPDVAAFPDGDRIRQIRLPPVKKLASGAYVSWNSAVPYPETIAVRRAIIRTEAARLSPHLMIVDKEPGGLEGELLPTLAVLRDIGSTIVLGLRDVLDAPDTLRLEWQHKGATACIERFYDELWVYGPSDFYDPLQGIPLPERLRDRVRFTGFLARSASCGALHPHRSGNYLLVAAGGGGDGYPLLSAALDGLRASRELDTVIVTGPYMHCEEFLDLQRRASTLRHVKIVRFDPRMQDLVAGARAMIAMCGYNSFCEALSFDIPTLYVPRTAPRQEQWIRAQRSHALGWSAILTGEQAEDRSEFAAAIDRLMFQLPPSRSVRRPDLGGLGSIGDLVSQAISPAWATGGRGLASGP